VVLIPENTQTLGEAGAGQIMKPIRKIFHRLNLAYQAFRYGEVRPESAEELRTITEEEISEVKEFFPMPKYFVFGHARSGTTLLARLLRVHPDVHCNWQTHFFTRRPFLEDLVSSPEIRRWMSQTSNRWIKGDDFSPLALRVISDFMLEREARKEAKSVVGDKSPNTAVQGKGVVRLHRLYPEGKLIFIVRDGRDAVLSHRFLNFIDFPDYLPEEDLVIRDAFAADPEPFFRGEKSLFSAGELQQAAKKWVNNVEETHCRGKEMFGSAYYSLRFEDLVAQPDRVMTRLWEFLGVDVSSPTLSDRIRDQLSQNPDAAWQRQQAGDLVSNLQKGKAGSWLDLFTQEDKDTFHAAAGDTLRAWGYK